MTILGIVQGCSREDQLITWGAPSCDSMTVFPIESMKIPRKMEMLKQQRGDITQKPIRKEEFNIPQPTKDDLQKL